MLLIRTRVAVRPTLQLIGLVDIVAVEILIVVFAVIPAADVNRDVAKLSGEAGMGNGIVTVACIVDNRADLLVIIDKKVDFAVGVIV
ncbi:hypothetical protein ES703_100682 [subsurface metagenome]